MSSNKGNTGAGRKRRSIKANIFALVNSVAVITALLSTCHFIFVPSIQQQQQQQGPFHIRKENPIQKLLNKRRGKNNGTELASVASIIEDTADSKQPAFDFGDDDTIDDDDDLFQTRKTNETKSFWESLKENLGQKEKVEEQKNPTSSLRKSQKAPP